MKTCKICWVILGLFLTLTACTIKELNKEPTKQIVIPTDTPYAVLVTFTPAPTAVPAPTPTPQVWDGPVLNTYVGAVEGPSGKETYYNLPMDYVVYLMRELGYSEEEYPYWVRDDGCKMLGDYIMCAAALDIRPKGTILESSLGTCIVCDTGEFVNWNHTQIDIAVNW